MKRSKEEIQKAIDESTSVRQVLIKLDLKPINGNYLTFYRKVKEYSLDINCLKQYIDNFIPKNKKNINEYLILTDKVINSSNLRKRLIKEGLLEEKCSICKIENWLGKKIIFQLDHIDGNHFNNQISNLRILCPNCHSQTETYCKNHKNIIKICKCGNETINGRKKCNNCSEVKNKVNKKVTKCPSKEQLEQDLIEFNNNLSAIGRKYSVSDNAVRKWIKKQIMSK
jgi:hypothetical protein